MRILQIIGLLLVVIGIFLNYGAKYIVKRFELAKKQKVEISEEMTCDEIEQYRLNKSILRVKLFALTLLLPGILLAVFET